MPSQHAEELRAMTDEELEGRLSEAKQEVFDLRFRHVTGQLPNHAAIGEAKREVARITTVLRMKEIEAAEAAEANA
jgi:large subunit ribosomal protein L29